MKNIKTYEHFENIKTLKDFFKDNNFKNIHTIDSVTCRNGHISNLNGIEECINLEELYITNNELTSLKGIENLTKLVRLDIRNNILTSLEGLENLTELKSLSCYLNKITSLKPILNCDKLYTLDCGYNKIDWVDYIDKQGNTWYIELPKSIRGLNSDKFNGIKEYWKFMDKNQPVAVSRKFNF